MTASKRQFFAEAFFSKPKNEILLLPLYEKFPGELYGSDPVVSIPFTSPPQDLGRLSKAILFLSNERLFKDEKAFSALRRNYPTRDHLKQMAANIPEVAGKQTHMGRTEIAIPGYLQSKAENLNIFNQNYFRFSIHSTIRLLEIRGFPFTSYLKVDNYSKKSTSVQSSIPLECRDNELGTLMKYVYDCCQLINKSGLQIGE